MPNLLSLPLLDVGVNMTLLAQQAAGLLDLIGLAVGIWTVWSSITLPLGGNLQRAFRLIGLGALAFACSHVIDSFILDLRLVNSDQALLIMQTTVLFSMLFFVPGLAALADVLPTLPEARGIATLPHFWPFGLALVVMISAFSFILYGVTPEAETIAFFGLDGSIIIMVCLCILLLLRAHIGGMIGRYLWLAMLAMLTFSLAHPAQVWLYSFSGLSDSLLAILHRLIVMPALLLFAFSLTRLSRKLNTSLYLEAQAALVSVASQKSKHQKASYIFSARARATRNRQREQSLKGPTGSRPFPALRQRASGN